MFGARYVKIIQGSIKTIHIYSVKIKCVKKYFSIYLKKQAQAVTQTLYYKYRDFKPPSNSVCFHIAPLVYFNSALNVK